MLSGWNLYDLALNTCFPWWDLYVDPSHMFAWVGSYDLHDLYMFADCDV